MRQGIGKENGYACVNTCAHGRMDGRTDGEMAQQGGDTQIKKGALRFVFVRAPIYNVSAQSRDPLRVAMYPDMLVRPVK